jgi:hypothetical protein
LDLFIYLEWNDSNRYISVVAGINEEAAEQILSSFYYGQDAPGDNGEASPLKVSFFVV